VEELKRILEKVGFNEISIEEKEKSDEIIKSWNFGEGVEKMVFSAYIKAKKPSGKLPN
jgi:hypothetical protein